MLFLFPLNPGALFNFDKDGTWSWILSGNFKRVDTLQSVELYISGPNLNHSSE